MATHQELTPAGSLTPLISAAIDARPMLSRSPDNVWERAEQVRSRLYEQIEEECRRRGMEALVLQSGPYVHPAWVKFEAWRPRAERSLTARSTLTITITTRPFHRFETIYKAEWHHLGYSGSIDDLHSFDAPALGQVLELLCDDRPDAGTLGIRSRIRRLLGIFQLRQVAWHFWKPRNRVVALRRDWLPIAGIITMLIGLAALLGASTRREPAPLFDDFPTATSLDPEPVALPPAATDPQYDPETGAQLLLPDQLFAGYLSAASNLYSDNTPYDLWAYTAEAGETIRVTVVSAAFDAVLEIGQIGADGYEQLAMNDDTDGTNPVLVWTPPAEGNYLMLARAYAAGSDGSYTIQLTTSSAPDGEALAASPPSLQANPFLPSEPDTAGGAWGVTGVLGAVVFCIGILGTFAAARAPRLVRSSGKPMAEPRVLYYLDSWQTVVFGAGHDEALIRERIISRLTSAGERFHCSIERIWDWGLDGKTEREQIVLRLGRALVFSQVHRYGDDLYVGWDAQMNLGTWREKSLGSGIDRESGRRIRLQTVEQAVQRTTEYDLIDLNCLAEWAHAQITQVLKQYVREQEIDQEIDFSIIRGERKGLTEAKDDKGKRRQLFQRSA